MFLHLCVILFDWRGVCIQGGLHQGGSASRGVCIKGEGSASKEGICIQGGLHLFG